MIYFRNGELHENDVCLDLAQPAFRTGFGFFETICWNGSKACHLDLHLERARNSLAEFCVAEEPLDYEAAIEEVVNANGLLNEFARVNIFFPVETDHTQPIVCAVPFEYVPQRTWTIKPNPHIFLTPLMAHKSTNRMDYLNAWKTAQADGFDDALLQDFEGNVLESSFASLLFKAGDTFIEPKTDFKLPGTACIVASRHIEIDSAVINVAQIDGFDHVYALNSLGGMIPVTAIGCIEFEPDFILADGISAKILELKL
ncbi:aminotransferase class IV [Maridesulfovibrio salexigens]|uniref:Aminotransferase class IV n=1 Tax=Maridesulfovibrio salexigens (strain ATCC 14822 / DSM 2638 / NCIMB 8403 / VKM B-1763) TaxID=526222 RepID=C6C101_MARSD|nr:aminotransferase class IV [Maridesulfovibrio salexigens]ACS79164.1 aminotransferase class IV [Maridesulfovibrio salexigens DSM 2638]